MRKPHWLLYLLLLSGFVFAGRPLRAQMSEEEKRRLFLQAREDIRPVPKASASATPRPKPQPASTPTPRPKPKPTPEEEPQPTPRPKATPEETPEATPTPRSTPKPKPAEEEEEPTPRPKPVVENTPAPKPDESPRPKAAAEPTPDVIALPEDSPSKPVSPKPAVPAQIPSGKTPGGNTLNAPIVIEKSGLQEDRGYEPPPKQQFQGFFKRWRYLSPSVRKAIDQAKVKRGRWKYIIVHNSGTRQGNARIFEVYHRKVRKMQNGLAYHFVIGNGNSSGDGEVEIGNRWTRQINGGHVASDYLNDISLGICLVGDLNRDTPTKAQLGALDELITYLRGRVGKVKGKAAIVKGHKEINPKPTDCPGDRFPLRWLRQRFDK